MDTVRLIFELNEPIILFGYGLVFFVMGLAIALQSRSSSRLELARSLAWLAAFGILHSLYEWGELFSPVQEVYLSPEGIEALHGAHLLALSLSFTALLQFGMALLRPLYPRWSRVLSRFAFVVAAAYAIHVLFILPELITDPRVWHHTANALARYLIGFPGALLAAYGLREQTFRHIDPLDVPRIVSMLRMAGIALAAYAVLGGLIPPPVPFFPGNIINEVSFEAVTGLPPLVFQALTGLILAVTIIRALEVFTVETERRIELMEQQQILIAERDRIARELHDGSIQTVYTASLLVDSARKLAAPGTSLADRLEKAVHVLNDAIKDLRRNLGDLRSAPSGEILAAALHRITSDPRFRSMVDISLDLSISEDEQLSPLRTDHVLSIVSEALSNTVRHANATQARVIVHALDDRLKVIIKDNGTGFNGSSGHRAGFGLRNMQDRARLLGGNLEVLSEPGKGTTVYLDIPWKDER